VLSCTNSTLIVHHLDIFALMSILREVKIRLEVLLCVYLRLLKVSLKSEVLQESRHEQPF